MWLSKNTISKAPQNGVEYARLTINDGNQLEAVATGAERSLKLYAPYGYSFSPAKGSDILVTRSAGEQVSFAAKMEEAPSNEGEIKITAQSGAYIYLKSDGSVIINGMKINGKGVIE